MLRNLLRRFASNSLRNFDDAETMEKFLRSGKLKVQREVPLSKAEIAEKKKSLVIPSGDLRASYSRSSGPGGQHVNKTESKVTLFFKLSSKVLNEATRKRLAGRLRGQINSDGELFVVCQEGREQSKNEIAATENLKRILAENWVELKEEELEEHREEEESRQDRIDSKRKRSQNLKNKKNFDL